MKRKWWEVRGDQSQVRRSTRKLRVGGSGSSEGNDSGHLNVSNSLMIARRSRTSSAVPSCESISNATQGRGDAARLFSHLVCRFKHLPPPVGLEHSNHPIIN